VARIGQDQQSVAAGQAVGLAPEGVDGPVRALFQGYFRAQAKALEARKQVVEPLGLAFQQDFIGASGDKDLVQELALGGQQRPPPALAWGEVFDRAAQQAVQKGRTLFAADGQ
jgi:hypothetical protein